MAIGYALIVIALLFYVYDVTNNSDWFSLNPPSKVANIPFETDYFAGSSNVGFPSVLIVAKLETQYGYLIAGQPARITAVAIMNQTTLPNISIIRFGFEDELGYSSAYQVPELNGVTIYEPLVINFDRSSNMTGMVTIAGDIAPLVFWDSPGNYYASLTLVNSTGAIVYSQQTTTQVIEVEPASVLQNQQFSKVNQALTIALVFFAFTESIFIIGRIWGDPKPGQLISPRDPSQREGDAPPPQVIHNPERESASEN